MSEEKQVSQLPDANIGSNSRVAKTKDDQADSDLSDLEMKEGERKDAEQDALGKKYMENPPVLKVRTSSKGKNKADNKNQKNANIKPTWAKQKKKKKFSKRHSLGAGKKGMLIPPSSLDSHTHKKKSKNDFTVAGIGVAGIEDMREILDDSKVWYGLMQVAIGTGNFKRTKLIFISFLGEECSAVKRGKASRMRQQAEKLLGHSHAAITFHSKEECTFDALWSHVGGIFASDNLNVKKKGWSWEKEKIEYEKQMAKKKKEMEVAKLSKPIIENKKKASHVNRVPEILSILRQDMGWINWALFKPTKKKLVLVSEDSYGDGSIPQMRDFLSMYPDKVLYGLLRMAFGVKPYRRTHYVFFHWVGEKTKIVMRGKWNSLVDGMSKMLRPFNITVQVNKFENMTLKDIILMVKKWVIVDNIKDAGKNTVESLFNQFRAAMEEERKLNEAKKRVLKVDTVEEEKLVVEEEEEEKFESIKLTIREAVTLVSSEMDDENWVLIAPPGHERGIRKRQYRIHSCENQG